MKRTRKVIKIGDKEELKTAILSCKNADCDTLIVLNGQTEYLIYSPFGNFKTGILSCETNKAFLRVIKNINKIAAKLSKSKRTRKDFQL